MKKFEELSKKEKRRILAKDVIKQINARKLSVLDKNGYLSLKDGHYFKDIMDIYDKKVIDHKDVQKLQKSCNVCAKGALLLSRIDKFNTLSPVDIGFYEGISGTYFDCEDSCTISGLDDIFSEKQLNLIEDAFETTPDDLDEYIKYTKSDITDAMRFGGSFDNPEDRLVAIMQNVVDHGEFKPKVMYEMV